MSIFSKVSLKKPKSSTFNLSHQRKFTLNMGELVPILCQETIPGDVFDISTSQILRMQPMLSPIMHDINVTVHFFFVPNRILWNNWEPFITGGESGLSTNIPPNLSMKLTHELHSLLPVEFHLSVLPLEEGAFAIQLISLVLSVV